MKTFILSFLFFFSFFFYRGTDSYDSVTSVQKTWSFKKELMQATNSDKRNDVLEVKLLNGFLSEDFFYHFSSKTKYNFELDDRIVYALNSPFFLKYQKIAKEAAFFSSRGEVLWKRQMNAYPRINHKGDTILFISGDHNQVSVFDENGNQIGDNLQGIFLTDYFFTPLSTFILFSNGQIYQVDRDTKSIKSHSLASSSKELNFFKSFFSSLKKEFLAVHVMKENKDEIIFLNQEFKDEFKIKLDKVYPYKIYFSISPDGYVMLNLPEKLVFFKKNEKLWTYEKKVQDANSTYYLSYFTGKFFLASFDNELLIFDEKGNLLEREDMSDEGFMRGISSFSKDAFFIETKKSIFHYQKIDNLSEKVSL